jgi:hypothetical protein
MIISVREMILNCLLFVNKQVFFENSEDNLQRATYLLDEKNIILKLKIHKMMTMTLRWAQHTGFKIVTEHKKLTNITYPDYVSYLGNMDIDNTIMKFQQMNGTILTILKTQQKK